MGKGNEERATWIGNYPSLTFWICPACLGMTIISGCPACSPLLCARKIALCPKNCFVSENVNYKHIKPAVTAGFNG